jgi:hypothetical protein
VRCEPPLCVDSGICPNAQQDKREDQIRGHKTIVQTDGREKIQQSRNSGIRTPAEQSPQIHKEICVGKGVVFVTLPI